jgi:Exostosin family
MLKVFVPTREHSSLVTDDNELMRAFMGATGERFDIEWCKTGVEANFILLFERWSTKFANYAAELRQDLTFAQYKEKIVCINQDDAGRGFLAGCYTSLTRHNLSPRIHRAIPFLQNYNGLLKSDAVRSERTRPRYLFSFRGASLTNPIRRELFKRFASFPDAKLVRVNKSFGKHGSQDMVEYVEDILQSKFVLCPAGWSPQTIRLFETMQLGRCPVIISDQWVPIAGIDWRNFAVIVPERDLKSLPKILAAREAEAAELGTRARAAWAKEFGPERRFLLTFSRAIEVWREIRERPVNYDELYSSWRFNYGNKFTLGQRFKAGIARRITQFRFRDQWKHW